MSAVLFVRIESDLGLTELERRIRKRKPGFLEVPGLLQKIYGHDPESGDICGIYFFASHAALEAYRETVLAQSIPQAYAATHVRREMFEVLDTLRPDQGPV